LISHVSVRTSPPREHRPRSSRGADSHLQRDAALTVRPAWRTCDLWFGQVRSERLAPCHRRRHVHLSLNCDDPPGLPQFTRYQCDGHAARRAPLPLALVSQVFRHFGNALTGTPVSWVVDRQRDAVTPINRSTRTQRVRLRCETREHSGYCQSSVGSHRRVATASATFTSDHPVTHQHRWLRSSAAARVRIVNQASPRNWCSDLTDAHNDTSAVPKLDRHGEATCPSASTTADQLPTLDHRENSTGLHPPVL